MERFLSGEPLDQLLLHEGREKERENLRNFGVYERVPRHQAVGKRVRVQWLDDYKRNVDGLFGMQTWSRAGTVIDVYDNLVMTNLT